jgi:hypothetical protein
VSAALIAQYKERIASAETAEALDAIMRELEERLARSPGEYWPQLVIGMARVERFLAFQVPL